jgi:hypothetical protein
MATSSPAGPAGAEVLAAQDGTVDLSIALPAAPRTESAPPSQEVRAAIRLGWSVAEVRGRHWWRGQRPPTTAIPVDPPYALPLRPERTAAESRTAARDSVMELAEHLGVAHRFGETAADAPSFPERLRTLAGPLEADGGWLLTAPEGTPSEADLRGREAAWAEVASLLHEWDSSIQDTLGARADMLANGYLLGRGLAECYWALGPDEGGPDVPPSSAAWGFLLGPGRRSELARLAGRLAPHLPPLTPTAVDGSLQAWGDVSGDPAWRAADGRQRLFEQYRRWYELLILGRDPTTYVKPYAVLRGWRTSFRAFRAFWLQLVLAAASAAAVAAVAYFLGTDRGSALLTTVLGLFGAVGLTAAGVVARAKTAGQQVLARLRQDVYGDLVSVAVTVVPEVPDGPRGRAVTERRVRAAVRRRHVTPVTPMTDGVA